MTEGMLQIEVNGQTHRLRAPASLADLIERLERAPHSIATALNGEFVARHQRHARALRDGDRVTCFQAIVGG